jgi:hypothetical protein
VTHVAEHAAPVLQQQRQVSYARGLDRNRVHLSIMI